MRFIALIIVSACLSCQKITTNRLPGNYMDSPTNKPYNNSLSLNNNNINPPQTTTQVVIEDLDGLLETNHLVSSDIEDNTFEYFNSPIIDPSIQNNNEESIDFNNKLKKQNSTLEENKTNLFNNINKNKIIIHPSNQHINKEKIEQYKREGELEQEKLVQEMRDIEKIQRELEQLMREIKQCMRKTDLVLEQEKLVQENREIELLKRKRDLVLEQEKLVQEMREIEKIQRGLEQVTRKQEKLEQAKMELVLEREIYKKIEKIIQNSIN